MGIIFIMEVTMTPENYAYRNSLFFLRNDFIGNNKWHIPDIPKFEIKEGDFDDCFEASLKIPSYQYLHIWYLNMEGRLRKKIFFLKVTMNYSGV